MILKLIDSHCHLEASEFNNILDSILNDALNAEIVKLITSAVTYSEWSKSENIHKEYNQVEYSIGVHPWYVSESDRDIKTKLDSAYKNGAIAIGEIGLDKKIDSPAFDLQLEIFELQLQYAVDADIPVIIHCRGAFNELIESLNRYGVPRRGGLIHAYSGSPELTEILIRKGLSFSMGGTLTYKNSKKRGDVLKMIYPDHFLLETDSPDIPPVNTIKPNVPSNILINLKAASEILDVPEEKIADNTTANAIKLFGLKL
ncbi:MAG: hypothetical protein CVV49_09685 [Spirochaetae bacterium HGW-Spirochaetae-5]|nr:MAG: hypothetical protein CVV49_09685 [Spirochaetae bacterium HGW-Spirochaetae-5]